MHLLVLLTVQPASLASFARAKANEFICFPSVLGGVEVTPGTTVDAQAESVLHGSGAPTVPDLGRGGFPCLPSGDRVGEDGAERADIGGLVRRVVGQARVDANCLDLRACRHELGERGRSSRLAGVARHEPQTAAEGAGDRLAED